MSGCECKPARAQQLRKDEEGTMALRNQRHSLDESVNASVWRAFIEGRYFEKRTERNI